MTLHLLPNLLAEGLDPKSAFVPVLYDVIPKLSGLIAESRRNAFRYLKLFREDFRDMDVQVLSEHTDKPKDLLKLIKKGEEWGLISDCGLPFIADPASKLVALARAQKMPVIAYPGPSSIIQALALSGLSAQSFTFHGYLPRDPKTRMRVLKNLIHPIAKFKQTQIFIEAPYRNNHMRDAILTHIPSNIKALVASDLMMPSEQIIDVRSKPDIHKKPAVFLLGI